MSKIMTVALRFTAIDMARGVLDTIRARVSSVGRAGQTVKRDFEEMTRHTTAGLQAIAAAAYAVNKIKPGVQAAGNLQTAMIGVRVNLMEADKSFRQINDELAAVRQTAVSVSQIAAKDVPAGKPYKVINDEDAPTDRSYRAAWEMDMTEPDGVGADDGAGSATDVIGWNEDGTPIIWGPGGYAMITINTQIVVDIQKQRAIDLMQKHMDAKARAYGYDHIYRPSAVPGAVSRNGIRRARRLRPGARRSGRTG